MSRRPNHIGIVTSNFPSRSETFVTEHAIGLRRRGYRVTVFSEGPASGISDEEIRNLENEGIQTVNHGQIRGRLFQRCAKMISGVLYNPGIIRHLAANRHWTCAEMLSAQLRWNAIAAAKPDLIHIHFGLLAGPMVPLELPPGTVVTWHGYDSDVIPQIRGKNIYKNLFLGNYRHTVNSAFLSEQLKMLGASSKQISIVPMGVDLQKFIFRRRVWCPDQPLKLVSVGRLHEMKGHAFLIRAVSELINEGLRLELQIIGGGPLQGTLQRQIEESGHAHVISLPGPRVPSKVIEALYQSDVFALTGILAPNGQIETQGVVFGEAQAIGLPVIASRIGGVLESVSDGNTGILCNPGDVGAIKDAIRFFWNNPHAISEFGDRGRKLVESKFSQVTMLDSFEQLYSDRVS